MEGKNSGETLVLKLSGSLFFSSQFEHVVKVLRSKLIRSSISLILVAGGGPTARKYIDAGNNFQADQSSLDEIGIAISRLNAIVLRDSLGELAFHSIPESLDEIVDALGICRETKRQRAVVCGGLNPGQSTNAVAALAAEKSRAIQLLNATDVEGVYTKDPKKSGDARMLPSVSAKKLAELLRKGSIQAGKYDLMDPVALKIISRSKIPTRILKCDPMTLQGALSRKSYGTRITS